MTITIKYNTKDRVYSAYCIVRGNKIKVCENGTKANFLFDGIRQFIEAHGSGKDHTIKWLRV